MYKSYASTRTVLVLRPSYACTDTMLCTSYATISTVLVCANWTNSTGALADFKFKSNSTTKSIAEQSARNNWPETNWPTNWCCIPATDWRTIETTKPFSPLKTIAMRFGPASKILLSTTVFSLSLAAPGQFWLGWCPTFCDFRPQPKLLQNTSSKFGIGSKMRKNVKISNKNSKFSSSFPGTL